MKNPYIYIYTFLFFIIFGCNNDDFGHFVILKTKNVSMITDSSAVSGGDILSNDDILILENGICWSSERNPTLSDYFTKDGASKGSFTSTLNGLSSNKSYFLRSYAVLSQDTIYGDEKEFSTTLQCPIVSFTFDDNFLDQTSVLERKGVCGTIAFTMSLRMNLAEMHRLEDNGWEIASHSLNHNKSIESEYSESKEYLKRLGFNVMGFITPGGGANFEQDGWARKYYEWARDVVIFEENFSYNWALCNFPPLTVFHLKGVQTEGHSLMKMKEIVDTANAGKFWVIWMIHKNDITDADLSSLINYIQSKGIEILTVKETLIKFKY